MAELKRAILVAVLLRLFVSIGGEQSNPMMSSDSADKRQAREYYQYFPSEEEKKTEYPSLTYPPSYYPVREDPAECPPGPLMPLLGNGLNFLLLKLGALGVIKAIVALVFLGFLAKLPLLLVKLAFVKSFFLPVLMAPLLVSFFQQHMMQPTKPAEAEDKPSEAAQAGEEGSGRNLQEVLTQTAWQSAKMLATSEKCVERIACVLGAHNNETSVGETFSRVLKYLQYSSPTAVHDRITSIRSAFRSGVRGELCSSEGYKCPSPELVLKQGGTNIKVL